MSCERAFARAEWDTDPTMLFQHVDGLLGLEGYEISHVGGEVFTAMDEPSDRCCLWGELFKEKERHFFRKELTDETVCFSIKDTFQILVRCLWQPHARNIKTRRGPFAMLLHGMQPPLTSSWTWIKLGRPLFQKGFSVVMLDFPGFGRSKMNMDSSVGLDAWSFGDWHLICQCLDELKVHKAHFVATGQACGASLRILMRSPHSMEKEMIWYNPSFNIDEMMLEHVGPPPPGGGIGWREQYRLKQVDAMERVLKNTNARIWSMHDKDHLSPEIIDVQSLLASVCRHAVLRHRTQIQDVSSHDLCPVHIGAQLPTYFLYIAKPLATAMVDFFTKRERGGQMLMAMPRYVSADPAIKPLPPDEVWSVESRAPRNPSAKGSFSHSDPLKWGFALSARGEPLDSRRPSRSTTKLAPLMPKPGGEGDTTAEDENPLIRIMRKARPQTTAASVDERGRAAPVDVYGMRAATAGALGVAMARWRKGAEAYDNVRYTSCTQTKHPVRAVEDREQVSILSASQEAFNLTGGKNQAQRFRIALLSKLNHKQRNFVYDHQSPEQDPNAQNIMNKTATDEDEGESRDGSSTRAGTRGNSKPLRSISRLKSAQSQNSIALSNGSTGGDTPSRSVSALKNLSRSMSRQQNATEPYRPRGWHALQEQPLRGGQQPQASADLGHHRDPSRPIGVDNHRATGASGRDAIVPLKRCSELQDCRW
eukprot:s791_g5.t1